MIRANLIAERVAIESYSQIIELIGERTRPLGGCSRTSSPTNRTMSTN